MTLLDLIVAGLATWQIIEIWHHGRIFSTWRACVELWTGLLGELLLCPFCLAPWTGWATTLVLLSGAKYLPGIDIVVYGLAVARFANLGNDLTYQHCRTVRHDSLAPLPAIDDTQKVLLETPHDEYNNPGTDESVVADARAGESGTCDGSSPNV